MRKDNLKVLVIGGGGREHALAWKLSQSPRVAEVFCAPGNAGTALIGTNVALKVTDFTQLIGFAKAEGIDFTVVGPETPLIAGIVDVFEAEGLLAYGPSADAAQLEGSKVFTKEILFDNGIPTGTAVAVDTADEAIEEIKAHFAEKAVPIVIKADGEAAGKGVIIAKTEAEATEAIDQIMVKKVFGKSGDRVLLEEFLVGQEASLMCFVDGNSVAPMVPAQDYKRAYDADEGPNTGGMGCYSPVPVVTDEIYDEVLAKIICPTISGLSKKGIRYRGILYAGIILTEQGPKLIEYNCRFGDPETQVVLPRLETDLVDIIEASFENRLDGIEIKWYNSKAVCVVLASGGYPGDYDSGVPISGLADAESAGVIVFHAGTKLADDEIVTAGGRVLGVTATGETFKDAIDLAYSGVKKIHFDKMHYRNDIGARVAGR
jgi:phosphoribosylamine--glycine ligase